jgi:hypothetical protein
MSGGRRTGAGLVLLLYVGLMLLRPALHVANHQRDHRHTPPGAIDWSRVKNGSGQVDLAALARALGLDDVEHQAQHRTQAPHTHEGEPPTESTDHGEGASEHFGLALLLPVPRALVAQPGQVAWPLGRTAQNQQPGGRLLFLGVQRAQAPPHSASV